MLIFDHELGIRIIADLLKIQKSLMYQGWLACLETKQCLFLLLIFRLWLMIIEFHWQEGKVLTQNLPKTFYILLTKDEQVLKGWTTADFLTIEQNRYLDVVSGMPTCKRTGIIEFQNLGQLTPISREMSKNVARNSNMFEREML